MDANHAALLANIGKAAMLDPVTADELERRRKAKEDFHAELERLNSPPMIAKRKQEQRNSERRRFRQTVSAISKEADEAGINLAWTSAKEIYWLYNLGANDGYHSDYAADRAKRKPRIR
jgi:hypothetical protein